MPFYPCDSSGLVKRYVDEVGSDWVRAIVDPASTHLVSIADSTRAEVTSALGRRAAKASSRWTKDELIQTFRAHCAPQYRIVPTQPRIIDLAAELIQRLRIQICIGRARQRGENLVTTSLTPARS